MVSTDVGGVTEVLPIDVCRFVAPRAEAICSAIEEAIPHAVAACPMAQHCRVRSFYSWRDVARRTETVYAHIAQRPTRSLVERLYRYRSCGPIAGLVACAVVTGLSFLCRLLDWYEPASSIEEAPNWASCSAPEPPSLNQWQPGDSEMNCGRLPLQTPS